MVRGRRNRQNQSSVQKAILNGQSSLEDHYYYCASPKRKDCKLETAAASASSTQSSLIAVASSAAPMSEQALLNNHCAPTTRKGAKTRSQSITKFFASQPRSNGQNGHLNGEVTTHTTNIFLQTPVLSLGFEKTPTDSVATATAAKSGANLVIRNAFSSLKVEKPSFQSISNGFATIGIQENISKISINEELKQEDIVAKFLVNDLKKKEKEEKEEYEDDDEEEESSTDEETSSLSAADKSVLEQSPSKRRKPTTPHRIVCPSPVKDHIVASSSSANLIETERTNNKKGAKSRRKLNGENVADDETEAAALLYGRKPVLNSTANPTAQQNTKNNHRLNGAHGDGSKKLTDFFPVRRSVRKTKKEVQEEIYRTYEKAILEGSEDGLEVLDFEGKGRGVITTRPFKKGDFVVEYIGDLITIAEANKRERKYAKDDNTGCYMYYFKHNNQQYCIDATEESGKFGRLVNHSRNGNLTTKTVPVNKVPHLVLIAKHDIQPGEELTYDYGDRSKEALLHHPWLAF